MNFTLFNDPTFYKNGQIVPSGSILYSGADLAILQQSPTPFTLPCNGNLNQVLNLFDQAIDNLLEQNDLTGLTNQGLPFNPDTVTISALHQVEINAIAGLQSSLTTLQNTVANLNAGTLPITINLGCLAGAASPCIIGTDTYPLIAVLNVIVSAICNLLNP